MHSFNNCQFHQTITAVVSWLSALTTGCQLVVSLDNRLSIGFQSWQPVVSLDNRLSDVSLVWVKALASEEHGNFFKVHIESLALSSVLLSRALDFPLHLNGFLPKLFIHEWWVVVVLTIRAWSCGWNAGNGLDWTSWLLLRGFHSVNECVCGGYLTFGWRWVEVCSTLWHRTSWLC